MGFSRCEAEGSVALPVFWAGFKRALLNVIARQEPQG